jgi:hypothetical protein
MTALIGPICPHIGAEGAEQCALVIALPNGPPGCHGVTHCYAAPSTRSELAEALPGLTTLLRAS